MRSDDIDPHSDGRSTTQARGRPRDPDVSEAILKATLKLLADRGFAGMSVEAVAAEASVGKTAIYRRYRGKAELVAAAMALLRDPRSDPDTGNARRDLIVQLDRAREAMVEGPGLSMMGTLLVESRRNPQLLEVFREAIMRPAIKTGRMALRRGIERGEVRADIDIDTALLALWGQVAAHFLVVTDFSSDWAERAVDVVWDGIAARDR